MKNFVCSVVFFFLYRGLRVLQKKDSRVRADLAAIPENFSLRLEASPKPGAASIVMVNHAGGLRRGKKKDDAKIVVTFKSLNTAFRVVTGRMGISECYARHAFYLKGNINEAMGFIRGMEYVEAYLFPRFITKRILKRVPKKELPSLAVYAMVLTGV